MRSALLLEKATSVKSALFPIPASPQDLPVFKALRLRESEAVLARNDLGRIAFDHDGHVDVLPVHYIYLNGWIIGRTASPSYLPENASVTLLVDEHLGPSEWRSVVVQGKLDLAQRDNHRPDGIYQRAISVVWRLLGRDAVKAEATPFHDLLFGIRAVEISGKTSLPRHWKELVSSAS